MKLTITNILTSFFFIAGLASPGLADHHKKPVELAGVWKAKASSDEGDRDLIWTFTKSDDGYTGTSKDVTDGGDGEDRKLDRINVEEKKVTLEVNIEQLHIKVVAEEKEAGKLVGKWSASGSDGAEYGTGEITAEKKKKIEFAGDWAAVSSLPDGNELKAVLKLSGGNDKLKGIFIGDSGELEIDKVKAEDKGLRMEFVINSLDAVIEAKLKDENTLGGKWIVLGENGEETATGDWSATRKIDLFSGNWDVTATVPNSDDYAGTLTLARKGDDYSGESASSDGEPRKLNTVEVDGEKIEFTVDFERDDFKGVITIKAELKEAGLVGTWSLASEDGSELASAEWGAKKSTKKESTAKKESEGGDDDLKSR